jgi:hypothetical protein
VRGREESAFSWQKGECGRLIELGGRGEQTLADDLRIKFSARVLGARVEKVELVDEAFCDELAATLPKTEHDGFWLTYDNWFMGRRLRHGTPNRKLALFRVRAGEYERIDEDRWSNLDMEIHEHPILAGSVGVIRTRIDHRDDRGLAHWKARHAEYAVWEARRALKLRADGNAPTVGRQATKYRVLDRRWLPAAYFLDGYVRRGGFLDGWPGLCHAWLKARYFAEIGRMLRRGV